VHHLIIMQAKASFKIYVKQISQALSSLGWRRCPNLLFDGISY